MVFPLLACTGVCACYNDDLYVRCNSCVRVVFPLILLAQLAVDTVLVFVW